MGPGRLLKGALCASLTLNTTLRRLWPKVYPQQAQTLLQRGALRTPLPRTYTTGPVACAYVEMSERRTLSSNGGFDNGKNHRRARSLLPLYDTHSSDMTFSKAASRRTKLVVFVEQLIALLYALAVFLCISGV